MAKNKDKKLRIFKAYSQNLDWLRINQPTFIENLVRTGIYLCPLCIRGFDESRLEPTMKNPLTLEHVPPEALGGKSKILTCKDCNSKSGHLLDGHLYKLLKEMDFDAMLPNSSTKAQFELNGNKVNGTVSINKEGVWNLNVNSKISHPKQAENFSKDLKLETKVITPRRAPYVEQFKTPTFHFTKRNTAAVKRAEVAVLRIAYLQLFSVFGNSILLSPFFETVRKQIQNPDEDIMPRPFWIKYNFSDEDEGINLIRSPKELRCFLIIINLTTDSGPRRLAIALPGHNGPGMDLYENIQTMLGTDGVDNTIVLVHIKDEQFVSKEKDVLAYIGYWDSIQD